ncbi:hypothetical protein F1609_27315 [Massilia sp. CCM 8693]|uniref:Uncharacterized protein n=1 Tax=Massilia aquatica TaxID=2609000 RepID=A0ABX0MG25_9BURK|nr:hypothetical protein [Massilia aquatica]
MWPCRRRPRAGGRRRWRCRCRHGRESRRRAGSGPCPGCAAGPGASGTARPFLRRASADREGTGG